MKRGFFTLALALIAVAAFAAPVRAEEYPSRPVEIISTYKEGGAIDMMLRGLAPHFERELGVPVIVTAMSGGNTIVGTTEYFNREPDGYTLYATLQPAISYMHKILENPHHFDEFDWINVQEVDYVSILVPEASPFQTFEEVVEFAKANPGKLTFGSMSMTSSSGPAFKILIEKLGLKVKEVTFESGAVLRPAVLGGHVDVAGIGAYSDFLVFGEDGGVRCLAYFANNKLDIWKDAGPLNDITGPKYGVVFSELGDQRLIGVRKEFREKYPERWDKLYAAYQRTLASDGIKEYYKTVPSLLQNNSPERSRELIAEYDKLLDEYIYLFD